MIRVGASKVLTNRQEKFVQAVLGGASLKVAYVSAGFSATNAASSASRLARTPSVRARINELQDTLANVAATRAEITSEGVLRGLMAIAENPNEPASARVRAYELVGKNYGLFLDRSASEVEWDGDPSKLTEVQLNTMINHYLNLAADNDPTRVEQLRRQALIEAGVVVIDVDPVAQ